MRVWRVGVKGYFDVSGNGNDHINKIDVRFAWFILGWVTI